MYESYEISVESPAISSVVYVDNTSASRFVGASVSDGDASEAHDIDSFGNFGTVSDGNGFFDSSSIVVSSGDSIYFVPYDMQTVVQASESSEVVASLNDVNSLLAVIFFFLLMEWTERKIKVVTDKIARNRKER